MLDIHMLDLRLAMQRLLSFALRICDEMPELSGGDVLEEHLVDLLKGAVGRLGLVEEEVYPAEDGEAAEDEGRLCAEVGLVGVEDEGQHELPHGEEALLDDGGQGDGLDAQPRGRRFRDDGVGRGADGKVVRKVVQDC
jgi:hypothetical protein